MDRREGKRNRERDIREKKKRVRKKVC